MKRTAAMLVALGAVLFLSLRLAAIGTEAINWDEFTYFARAADTLQSRELRSGGRPGLGTVFALPLVDGCTDEISVVHRARVLWTALVALSAAALWWLVRCLLADEPRARIAATSAVALWCLVPLFLRWSIQVRTDQPAILFSLLAGCALLASKELPALALLGGAAGGLGYLFSQKAIYSLALVGLLAAGDRFLRREWRPWRDALRGAFFALGALGVVRLFGVLVARSFGPLPTYSVSQGMKVLDYYRQRMDLSVYWGLLPTLAPHLLLAALFVAATALAIARRGAERRALALSWATLALGVAVALFHTGAFAYFWITASLFPAVALALAVPAILERWGTRPLARMALGAALAVLVVQAAHASLGQLSDSQRVQRESLWFLQRNFPAGQEGFHLDRAPFCRHERNPLPSYVSETILREFSGPQRKANVERFLERFRRRGVYFLLHSYRLPAFPREIQAFWAEHFLPYYQSVYVPGFRFDPASGAIDRFEVLVAGAYRFERSASGGGTFRLDGRAVAPGEAVVLEPGWHEADLTELGSAALLVWNLKEPPGDLRRAFYSEAMIEEIKFGRVRRSER